MQHAGGTFGTMQHALHTIQNPLTTACVLSVPLGVASWSIDKPSSSYTRTETMSWLSVTEQKRDVRSTYTKPHTTLFAHTHTPAKSPVSAVIPKWYPVGRSISGTEKQGCHSGSPTIFISTFQQFGDEGYDYMGARFPYNAYHQFPVDVRDGSECVLL